MMEHTLFILEFLICCILGRGLICRIVNTIGKSFDKI